MGQNLVDLHYKFSTICSEKDIIIQQMAESIQFQQIQIRKLMGEIDSISDQYIQKSISDLLDEQSIIFHEAKKYIVIDATSMSEECKILFPKEVSFMNKFDQLEKDNEVVEAKEQCQKILGQLVLLKDTISVLQQKIRFLQHPPQIKNTKKGISLEERMSIEQKSSSEQVDDKSQSSNYDRHQTAEHNEETTTPITFEKKKMEIDNSSDGNTRQNDQKKGFLQNKRKLFQNKLELFDFLDSPKRKPKQNSNPDYSTPPKLRPLESQHPPRDNTPPNQPYQPLRLTEGLHQSEENQKHSEKHDKIIKDMLNDVPRPIWEDTRVTPQSKKNKTSKIIYIRK